MKFEPEGLVWYESVKTPAADVFFVYHVNVVQQ